MNKFSLGTRIWLPAIAAASVIAAMAAFTAVRTAGQARAVQEVQTALREKSDLSAQWRGLTETNAARTLAILSSSDAELGKALKPDMEATSARVSELQKQLEALAQTPDEKTQLEKVAQARSRYIALRKEQTTAHESGPLPEGALGSLREAVKDYTAQQTGYMDIVLQQARAQGDAQVGDRLRNVVLVTAVLLGLCAMLLASAYYTARAILRPLKDAVRATERVASGDLSVRIDTQRKDEVGDLLRGIGHMVDALRRLIAEVSQGANNIQLASAEIATGNTDLSSRTEQAASSLQQTASSMQQLTATVRQSAESAAQANQLASSAAEAAQRGGSVVQQVVTNMEDISTSSRKIGDIIGVIDGIAFQTNILALNAAVEAARAGEQGRGFAVVASEVRSLAQRSAEAAKEIKTLIGASVDKVEHGAKLVQDAGSTMVDLVGSVRRVSDIIGEITAGAAEQRDGIDQVNIAVGQLDAMTQQNAALVEESAAAADSMKQQAHRLAEVVSTFRLEENGPGHSRQPVPVAHERAAKAVIRAAQTASRAQPAPAAGPIRDNGNTRSRSGDWESF